MYIFVSFFSTSWLELHKNGDAVPLVRCRVRSQSAVGESVTRGYIHCPRHTRVNLSFSVLELQVNGIILSAQMNNNGQTWNTVTGIRLLWNHHVVMERQTFVDQVYTESGGIQIKV